jgi:hypothetical protein
LGNISLDEAERQLDRLMQFFPRVDNKVSALFAVTTGQVAIAALNLTPQDMQVAWVYVPAALFFLCSAAVIVCLYKCAYPDLEGGRGSLIYFGEIARLREADYCERIKEVTEAQWRHDVVCQIWRNSEILSKKYGSLKTATKLASLSVLPWALTLAMTSLQHGALPLLSK